MHRARSTAVLAPYEESVASQSQVLSKHDQEKLVDRLHSDAKFKKEMRAIYDQVKAEKEMKECTFAPNAGTKKKNATRRQLRRDPSEGAFGKSKQLAVSLVRKEGTETEIGAVKELRESDSNKKAKARRTRGRNGHAKQQNSMNGPIENHMIIEDVMESIGNVGEDAQDDGPTALSKESAHSKRKPNNDELFEYLAYNGVKNQKAMELQKLKNRKDLEACTFRPQIIKYQRTYENNKNVYENLLQQQKDYKLYEQAKKEIELKDCSFQPTIDKKSERIAKQTREAPPEKSYEILHKKHQLQLEKAKKLVRDKENKEMSECTFAPQLLAKSKAVPRPSLAQQTSVPIDEQRIQMPVQSISSKMKHNKYKTESNVDSDSVAQSTPKTSPMLLKHQSSLPNLQKRKSKPDRQAQHVQNMNISATVRSNSSSMVGKDPAAVAAQTANNSCWAPSGRSSQEQSVNFKVAVYPPPVGVRRPTK